VSAGSTGGAGWHAGPVRLVLVGPPGSGKGTQGPVVAARLGVPYVATGDLLRDEVAARSDVGRRVAALLDRGELVPDELMVSIVAHALGDRARNGYVLDGFPRTLRQAEATESAGGPLPPPDVAVHLALPDQVVHERLTGRADEQDRSDDTDPAVIDRRLRVYADETAPLLDHYRRRGILVTVDADQPVEQVTEAILGVLRRAPGDA
jgi:adenylate kinase